MFCVDAVATGRCTRLQGQLRADCGLLHHAAGGRTPVLLQHWLCLSSASALGSCWVCAGAPQPATGACGQPRPWSVPQPCPQGHKGLPRTLTLSSSCSLSPAPGLPLGVRARASAHHLVPNVLCRDICCIPVSMLGQRDKACVGEVRWARVQPCPQPCPQDLGTQWEGWAEQHRAPRSPGGGLHFANSPTPCPTCCCPCLLHVKLPVALGWQITIR